MKTDTSKNPQQKEKKEKDKKSHTGYLRASHEVLEIIYSLDVTIADLKVLLFIWHNSARWNLDLNASSFNKIAKAIRIHPRSVKRTIRKLLDEGLLIIHREMKTHKHLNNQLGLNSDFFGKLILPPMPLEDQNNGSDPPVTRVVTHQSPVWCPTGHYPRSVDQLLERMPEELKNPLKENIKKTLKKGEQELNALDMGPEAIEARKVELRGQQEYLLTTKVIL